MVMYNFALKSPPPPPLLRFGRLCQIVKEHHLSAHVGTQGQKALSIKTLS